MRGTARSSRKRHRPIARDVVFLFGAGLLAALLFGHTWVPDALGSGVVLDSAAPWLGVGVPVLVLGALACRSRIGVAAAVIPLLVWAAVFGSWWAGGNPAPPGSPHLTLVTQNLYAGNATPDAAARALGSTAADLVALQEFSAGNREDVVDALSDSHPYRVTEGTVALWSRYPLSDTTVADVGAGWHRGLRTHVAMPAGDIVVYVVHLPSIRVGDTAIRDRGLRTLSRQLTSDTAERIVVAGDFNTAETDRHWRNFAPGYTDVRTGGGPGFTWPAAFPVARPDHVLTRGFDRTTAHVLRTPGADHRGIAVDLARTE
ncbi:endonuclease/exonuclease/phosphatase family protein [Nocardia mexicana]|uniref:endonuclease/exonuclease/phosphatase family protein n=1 Tax=Nocardia mexicana TaxID=279262 RepID=UPI0014717E0D|nr:endonuclease/exonuclease/phosphatase family protein [Nocardia mexicana]